MPQSQTSRGNDMAKAEDLVFFSVPAFDKLSRQQREMMIARFSDPLFLTFLDEQEIAAKDQLASINPDDAEENSEDFRQRVRKAATIWRFWSDFKTLTAQFK